MRELILLLATATNLFFIGLHTYMFRNERRRYRKALTEHIATKFTLEPAYQKYNVPPLKKVHYGLQALVIFSICFQIGCAFNNLHSFFTDR